MWLRRVDAARILTPGALPNPPSIRVKIGPAFDKAA